MRFTLNWRGGVLPLPSLLRPLPSSRFIRNFQSALCLMFYRTGKKWFIVRRIKLRIRAGYTNPNRFILKKEDLLMPIPHAPSFSARISLITCITTFIIPYLTLNKVAYYFSLPFLTNGYKYYIQIQDI